MAINPVNSPSLVPPQTLPKQSGNNVNVNNKVNNPSVAPQNKVANDGDSDDTGVKKTTQNQPQEGKSSVKDIINKFA